MLEHLKKSETELNELFAEYWKLRHEAGKDNITTYEFVNSDMVRSDIYMETLANKLNMKVVAD
jgi:kinetochore protein Nuf2